MMLNTPEKTNEWIPKMKPCLKGDAFSKPSFLVSILDLGGKDFVKLLGQLANCGRYWPNSCVFFAENDVNHQSLSLSMVFHKS